MTRSTLGAAALLAAALFASGCSKSPPPIVPVEGVVLLNDQPLPNAQLQFIPTQPGLGMEYIAVGTTDEKGRFKLSCKGQAGACACENRVTVADAAIPDDVRGNQAAEAKYAAGLKNRPIPGAYGKLATTPLVIEVTPDQKTYELRLKKNP